MRQKTFAEGTFEPDPPGLSAPTWTHQVPLRSCRLGFLYSLNV